MGSAFAETSDEYYISCEQVFLCNFNQGNIV